MDKRKYNASGCKDLTAYEAIENVTKEEKRVRKLLHTIYCMCELAGYKVESRIVLRDKETGKEWR